MDTDDHNADFYYNASNAMNVDDQSKNINLCMLSDMIEVLKFLPCYMAFAHMELHIPVGIYPGVHIANHNHEYMKCTNLTLLEAISINNSGSINDRTYLFFALLGASGMDTNIFTRITAWRT
jgi:hypothetical protein